MSTHAARLAKKISKLLGRVLALDHADEPVIATAPTNAAGEALPTYGQAPANMIEVRHEDGRMSSYPPPEHWHDWVEWDAKAWPRKLPRRYTLVPTICFNCESGCGLLAYVDKTTYEIRKFEGNPAHPGSRGRNCA
jgi:anaerobic selenocysteine-containing dehydrogenase